MAKGWEMLKIETKRIYKELGIVSRPHDFTTHRNYVECLCIFSDGLKIENRLNIHQKVNEGGKLRKKLTLLSLTLDSISEEYKRISSEPAYAQYCVAWIPVKSYYVIFNLFLLVEYLATADDAVFTSGHKKVLEQFKSYLRDKHLIFNKREFNELYSLVDVFGRKFKPGANLETVLPNQELRFVQLLKKLADYKKEDFKREKKLKNFRGGKGRTAQQQFLNEETLNICEFFYWYRIKANYRDLEFLNQEISEDDFKNFYNNYYKLTMSFYSCFRPLINDFSQIHLGRSILS